MTHPFPAARGLRLAGGWGLFREAKGNEMSSKKTRDEHLAWCKQRALEYVDAGNLEEAFTSFLSDVSTHPETQGIQKTAGMLGLPLLLGGHLNTPQKMREHIEGYN